MQRQWTVLGKLGTWKLRKSIGQDAHSYLCISHFYHTVYWLERRTVWKRIARNSKWNTTITNQQFNLTTSSSHCVFNKVPCYNAVKGDLAVTKRINPSFCHEHKNGVNSPTVGTVTLSSIICQQVLCIVFSNCTSCCNILSEFSFLQGPLCVYYKHPQHVQPS